MPKPPCPDWDNSVVKANLFPEPQAGLNQSDSVGTQRCTAVCLVAKWCLALWDLCGLQPARLLCPRDSQARMLVRSAFPSGELPRLRDQAHISCTTCMAGEFFITEAPGEPPVRRYCSTILHPRSGTHVWLISFLFPSSPIPLVISPGSTSW